MRPTVVLASAFAVSVVAWLAGQAPAPHPQNPPTFTGSIDLVKLDVSVYDTQHRPIKGLTAADFTVLEDKLPRPIGGFSEIDIPEPPPPTTPWMRDARDDVATNDVTDKRLFIIVIDDHSFGSSPGRPQPRRTAFDPSQSLQFKVNRDAIIAATESIINRLGPTDLAALVFVDDTRFNEEFTADHGRLRATIERGLKEEPYFNPLNDAQAVLYTTVDNLISVPARRKAVIDITNDLTCVQSFILATTDHLMRAANRAGARFYTLRPAAHVPQCGGPPTADLAAVAPDALFLTRAPLETGGEAFIGVHDAAVAEAAAQTIFEANSSYYMIGYTSADLQKIHFTRVLVDRPDAEIKTRQRYFPPAQNAPPDGPPPPATVAAMAGMLPKGDIPLRATAAAFAPVSGGGNRPAASVSIVLQVRQLREARTDPIRESLDVRVAAFTSDGEPRGVTTRSADIRVPAGKDDVIYEIVQKTDLPKPGSYELRISTHSAARKTEGSVYLTVVVPDFSHSPISLSDVVLSADNGLAVDGVDQLRALLPVTPTVVRNFDRGEPVTAFLRAYEGGSSALKPLSLRTRIIDQHGTAVFERAETIGPARFDRDRGTPLYVGLPTPDLTPGPYLLRLEATLGKDTITREMRFSVK